jgi:hypothetical protein
MEFASSLSTASAARASASAISRSSSRAVG